MGISNAGIRLYYASAVFVRHTMRTLYRDLSVEMKRISVNSSSSGSPLSSSPLPVGRETTEEGQKPDALKARHRREKSVFMALTVTGISRVSGLPGVWDV